MSFFVRTICILSLVLFHETFVYGQTDVEPKKDFIQEISARVVRINPDNEQVEASERIVKTFLEREYIPEDQEKVNQIIFVVEVFNTLQRVSSNLLERFSKEVDSFVEENIIAIREAKPQSPYALQRAVDFIVNDTKTEMSERLKSPTLLQDPESIRQHEIFFDERIDGIQEILEREGGVGLITDLQRDKFSNIFFEYETILSETKRRLLESDLMSVITDTDQDGLSDFSEEVLSKTDPQKKSTTGGVSSDTEILLIGKNAASLNIEDTYYENITQNNQIPISILSEVIKIEQRKSASNERGNIFLSGVSVPSSLVYGYIFPENIVFITKTNEYGFWDYTLVRDLEYKEYSLYIAHLQSDGRPVIRSKGYSFIHGVDASYLEGQAPITLVDLDPVEDEGIEEALMRGIKIIGDDPLEEFVREYFLIIAGIIILFGTIITIILIKSGIHKRYRPYYSIMASDGPIVYKAKEKKDLYEDLEKKNNT